MRLLLDTSAFLWWITDSKRVTARVRQVLGDEDNEVWFSVASGWEIAIKAGLRRVSFAEDPEQLIPEQLSANGFQVLPVQLRHALKVSALPSVHRDPFDRLLVAQALVEGLTIVSGDVRIGEYPVDVLWE